MVNKKIASEVAIGVILLVVIVFGLVFWMQSGKVAQIATQVSPQSQKQVVGNQSQSTNLTSSDYGFSFSAPTGWHIWEDNSAVLDLMNKTDFGSVLSSGKISELTPQRVQQYQTFMNNWKAESSQSIVFTDSQTLNLKDRSFANAGKIMSRLVDSEDILKQGEVTMNITASEVKLNDAPISDDKKESRNIKIGVKDARLLIVKNFNVVQQILIAMPINSNKMLGDKKVSALMFSEYVKKGDSNGVNKLVSFISSLNIADNK